MDGLQITPELEQALATQGYELTKKALCAPICKWLRLITKTRLRYPICKRDIEAGLIVLFDKPYSGKFLWTKGYENTNVGEEFSTSISCHDANYWQGWQDWPYDHERKLFHGQPVWCWDDRDTHAIELRFYDAVEKVAFCSNGTRFGRRWDNIEPADPSDYKDWMFEAFDKLDFSEVDK